MELLERYLQAVRAYLPKSQQEDILKELGENLRAQVEDKESELGRALNEDELAAVLKKHGHPLFVATRYRQTRHLIGSTLFPVYWFVVKIILGFVGFGYAISALVLIAQGKSILEVLAAIFRFSGAVLPTFAWVTIIFAVLDIGNNKFRLLEKITRDSNEKFDPRTLPALRPASRSPEGKPIPRYGGQDSVPVGTCVGNRLLASDSAHAGGRSAASGHAHPSRAPQVLQGNASDFEHWQRDCALFAEPRRWNACAGAGNY